MDVKVASVRCGGRLVVALAALCAVASSTASAQEHKTYRCKVTDVVTLAEDGRLRSDDNPRDLMRQLYDGAIIDTLTGAVTNRDGARSVWKIVKKGSVANDYILIPDAIMLDANDLAVVAATDFIRVRAWKENPTVRFLVFQLSTMASGPCAVVR
ncbi:hypothetical protein [Bradyrhizobium sp. F1.13.3]|uniref:hypothetical protein n=1 Tax=Bradyrhizobium sp. F1.13.3 TaxID=3156351 RepID=UPI0033999A83